MYNRYRTFDIELLDIEMEPQPTNSDPDQALRHIRSVEQAGVYVLLDFHPYIENPVHVRLLKDIATQAEERNQTIMLVSHEIDLQLHKGEVLGVFGLMGSGRSELAEIIFGLEDFEPPAFRSFENTDEFA